MTTDDVLESFYPPVFQGICVTSLALARNVDAVLGCDYTAILNVSETGYQHDTDRPLVYVQIPLADSERCDAGRFIEAVEALHELLRDGHRVVVHCEAGISRSPSVVGAYLVRRRLGDLLEAWSVKQCEPLPEEFLFYHSYLNDPDLACQEGLEPGLLRDRVFGNVVTAFRVMSFVRPEVYMRAGMWNALFPQIRGYLKEGGRDHAW